jgi:UDP-3-O-[3-hydroxymyristoyl] glucosamine N-acyltransferase
VRYLRSLWWIWLLRLDALLSHGRVELSQTVRLRTRVVFQGRGTLRIGDHALLGDPEAGMPGRPIVLAPRSERAIISIGARTRITNGVEMIAGERIEMGSDCLVGAGTVIVDSDFHGIDVNERSREGSTGAVVIGDRVWLGMRAIVLKRVCIGDGAVIGAGSVVSRAVNEGEVVAGNPARVLSRWAAV